MKPININPGFVPKLSKLLALGAVIVVLTVLAFFVYKNFIVTNFVTSTGNYHVCKICSYKQGDVVAFRDDQGSVSFGVVSEIKDNTVLLHSTEVNKQSVIGKVREEISPDILYGLDSKEFEDYYNLYQEEHVRFLRTALNAYIAHDSNQACIIEAAVTANNEYEGVLSGLDAFDPDYYISKFVVYRFGDNADGLGKNIQIVFQDRPDRIFYALVGRHPTNSEICLLGFNSQDPFTEEDMKPLIQSLGSFIFDKEHSL